MSARPWMDQERSILICVALWLCVRKAHLSSITHSLRGILSTHILLTVSLQTPSVLHLVRVPVFEIYHPSARSLRNTDEEICYSRPRRSLTRTMDYGAAKERYTARKRASRIGIKSVVTGMTLIAYNAIDIFMSRPLKCPRRSSRQVSRVYSIFYLISSMLIVR